MKADATILDATAGNRMIWRTKEHPKIIWIDVETELTIPPDKIMDCRHTDFSDSSLIAIFFDPPHWWGDKVGENIWTIRNKEDRRKINEKYKSQIMGAYYGTDKYKSKTELLRFLHDSQKEFYRILRPDGFLFLKWSEYSLPVSKIIPFFRDWQEMMRITVNPATRTLGNTATYWILFMKREGPKIKDLENFMREADS